MLKICEKCGKEFPHTILIDGKIKNLQNRKFCLDCSPFGNHNTRDLNVPASSTKICVTCNQEYDKSLFYKKGASCKKCFNAKMIKKDKDVKLELVNLFGNKCNCCNKSFNQYVYQFHHIDPSEKDFEISKLRSHTIKNVLPELQKCEMLCANCHSMKHIKIENWIFDALKTKDDFSDKSKYTSYYYSIYQNSRKQRAVEYLGGKCHCCGGEFHTTIYEFHHVDPTTKLYTWKDLCVKSSWEFILEEINKCIVVCSNCHRDLHYG